MGSESIGVGLIGHAFMGAVHSHAWRNVHRIFDTPLRPVLTVLGGRDETATKAAAAKYGFAEVETDWRALIAREDVELVDVCTPGDTHAEIAIAALEAGKHVLCEKPLANTLAEAERMSAVATDAAARGVRAMVAFNYRRVPALAHARRLLAAGALGEVRHVRANYLQDWLSDPAAPMSWRLRKDRAGTGALGDLGAHLVDTAQFVTGESIDGVSALTNTFVHTRPEGNGTHGEVTVDDAALFLGRLSGGGIASFEATRYALGRKNAMRLEVNGTKASMAFDFEAMNVLWWHDGAAPDTEAGFRRILVTEPAHPYLSGWWPPGHGLGYDHTFTNEMADLLTAIASETDPEPSFADGLRVQRVLHAVTSSAANEARWTAVAPAEQAVSR